ncbi:hypothetical protein CASFOL_014443 [Castilleja foliolosa]|uniref:F-box domain-containing protein n=1 Tax=Castilleja foliolosa TaxID=1961234 RepID=A0ABD3DMW0_9LAMI
MSLKEKETHQETSSSDDEDDDRYIPPEITFNILSRLPVKALFRFKCVSKEWRTLICQPRFVSTHLTRSPSSLIIHAHRAPIAAAEKKEAQPKPNKKTQVIRPDGHVIYVYGPPKSLPRKLSTIDRILDFPGSDAAGFIDPLVLIGGPNGVVCVAQGQKRFFKTFTLWNPATRSRKSVPSDPLLEPNPKLYHLSSAGLGFDPSRNEFKVIHIMRHRNVKKPDVAKFFSSRAGEWKMVSQPAGRPASFWVKNQACEAVVGGIPYWRATVRDVYVRGSDPKERDSLVWFDVRDDVFGSEPYAWDNDGREMCLGEIKDCLCVGVWDKGMGSNAGLDVWVKENESGSWNPRYRVGSLKRVRAGLEKGVVVGFCGNTLIVQQFGEQGDLIILDLKKVPIVDGQNSVSQAQAEELINFRDALPFTFKTMRYKESFTDIPKM